MGEVHHAELILCVQNIVGRRLAPQTPQASPGAAIAAAAAAVAASALGRGEQRRRIAAAARRRPSGAIKWGESTAHGKRNEGNSMKGNGNHAICFVGRQPTIVAPLR